MQDRSDLELIQAYAVSADETAFTELVMRHKRMVYRVCMRRLGDAQEAEDAVQAVFLVLARRAASLRREGELAGWLHKVARNVSFDALRQRARRAREREAAMENAADMDLERDLEFRAGVLLTLDEAIGTLPATQRQAVVLRYLEGYSQEDSALLAGCPLGTIKQRASRGLEELRRRLERRGVALGSVALAGLLEAEAQAMVPESLASSIVATVQSATGKTAGATEVSGRAIMLAKGALRQILWNQVKLAALVVVTTAGLGLGGVLTVKAMASADSGKAPEAVAVEQVNPKLQAAPVNTWVKILEEPSGVREWPIFYYAPNVNRFFLSAGIHRRAPRHFDTESFDLAAGKWINAYPDGAPYRKESGPTDAPASGFDEGNVSKPPFLKDKNGVSRIRMDAYAEAYATDTCVHHQFVFDPDQKKLYTYYFNKTGVYDPVDRKWTELKAGRIGSWQRFPMMYGSLAYDPVNREIVSCGGTARESGGTPGTWTLSTSTGVWTKVATGSAAFRELGAEAEGLKVRISALANAARNRFYVTETETEGKEDLSARLSALLEDIARLSGKLNAARLTGAEENACKVALEETVKLEVALKVFAGKLTGSIDSALLGEMQASVEQADRTVRTLDPEPCGRGHSQMATDLRAGKIVLFGGSTIDSRLSDTWVYDCRTRSWEQRWPKIAPSPRSGHTLAWLPKSGKIVMYGGSELWVYDLESNEWKRLSQTKDSPATGAGAVGPDDVLVIAGGYSWADIERTGKYYQVRQTWACKVDPSAGGSTNAAGGVSGAVSYTSIRPSVYDRSAKPDAAAVGKLLKDLPANQWTLLPKSSRTSARRDWGTLPYDTDRHQILVWGGGHSTYAGTDLAHFSIRTATWSVGYPVEDPLTRGNWCMADQTFRNHPNVPNHVWECTAYDPSSKKAVWLLAGGTWIYDPATRDWEYPPAPGLPGAHELIVSLAGTPGGVACWYNEALYLFDAKARVWNKLPVKGGQLGVVQGDETGMCYDSKRDCLWLSRFGDPMVRYDMATGVVTVIPGKGRCGFMRETVYVPEIDMLLNIHRASAGKDVHGNAAYDIENKKWVGVELPFSDKDQRVRAGDYWYFTGSRSLHYDPELKLAILYYTEQEIAVARLDRATIKTFEMGLWKPK